MQLKENSVAIKEEPTVESKNDQISTTDISNTNVFGINPKVISEKHNAEKLVEDVYYKKNVFQFDTLTPKKNMNSHPSGEKGKYNFL